MEVVPRLIRIESQTQCTVALTTTASGRPEFRGRLKLFKSCAPRKLISSKAQN